MINLLKRVYEKDDVSYYKVISKYMDNNQKRFIVTANPETFMTYKNNPEYSKIFDNDFVDIIPDGIGVVYACKMIKKKVAGRITGYDTMIEMFKLANQKKKSIYLFGTEKKCLDLVVEKLKEEYPRIKILGAKDGFIKDKDKVFKDIVKKKPDICLVALGIPMQEILINKYIKEFDKGLFMGVGGSFDVYSGLKSRAPKIFIKLRLEWLYRIAKEPKRLKRFWNNNIKFMIYILKNRKNK